MHCGSPARKRARKRGREVILRNNGQKLPKLCERHGYKKMQAKQAISRAKSKKPALRHIIIKLTKVKIKKS